ncbi:MAG: lytic transglycosylase domain-containing protein [Betaproteobacteria bacterium]|nr:lytic transglycosylase domain-containing protein [Betaproteobacteria bacterium]
MDIFTLLMACGPAVAPQTTTALIVAESGGNPYAIGDNTSHRSYAPKTKMQAIALATSLLNAGHRIDMGLTQISSPWLNTWRLSLDQVFGVCSNIRIGTELLAYNYQKCAATGTTKQSTLDCALSLYNTGTMARGYAYVARVLRAAHAPTELRSFPFPTASIRHAAIGYGRLKFPNRSVLSFR